MKVNSTPHATHEGGANQAGSFSISIKPPLTYEQQIDLMRSRGLIIGDDADVEGEHARTMDSLARERDRAVRDKVPCVLHNMEKYGDLPVWAAVEIMSMGAVSQLYGNLDASSCGAVKAIAADFGVKPFLLKSWLRHLTYVLNICGHHSRLYNRVMTTRPTLMRADARYDSNKEFPTLLVLKRMYGNLWPSRWEEAARQLAQMTETHGGVSLAPMGFPPDWKSVPNAI